MWFKTNSAIDILMTIFVVVQFSVPNNRRLRNKLQQTEAIYIESFVLIFLKLKLKSF